jgi:hypothetical protein
MAQGIWNWSDPILTTDGDDFDLDFGRGDPSRWRRLRAPLIACCVGIAVIVILTVWANAGTGSIPAAIGTIALLSIVWVVWVFVLDIAIVTARRSWRRHPVACVAAACVFLGMAGWPVVHALAVLLTSGDTGSLTAAVFNVRFVLAPLAAEVVLRGLIIVGEALGRLARR